MKRRPPPGAVLLLAATLPSLGGCAFFRELQPSAALVPPQANPYAAGEYALDRGRNTIVGRTWVRLPDGAVLTCAGDAASLLPNIPATRARLDRIYGSGNDFVLLGGTRPPPRDPQLDRLVMHARCSPRGDFRFLNVPDGAYFVTAGLRGRRRASIRAEVAVRGGVVREVELVRR